VSDQRVPILVGQERSNSAVEWITPDFQEITLNCEINSYASAEL
jgi:coenzyme PQQ precursor peptide PqqA